MSSEKSSALRSPWSQANPDSLPGKTLIAQTRFTELMETFKDSTEQSSWFLQGFSNASHAASFMRVFKT